VEVAHTEAFRKDGRAINAKVRLFAEIGQALVAARETGADPFGYVPVAVEMS
jgi:hypothetical protein